MKHGDYKKGKQQKGPRKLVTCPAPEKNRREQELIQYQKLALRLLSALNRSDTRNDIIHDILLLIKDTMGFEAVGIRLRDGDDFPYYETNGFPKDFLQKEQYLCQRDALGKIMRDPLGHPYLECMCGNVICRRTDPSYAFFTPGGSFWSNCTTELLATTTEKDRKTRTRNRCNGEGYESVALVPLESGGEIIGLLQLNDKRKNMFTREMIEFFEEFGHSISIGLTFKKILEELRQHRSFLEKKVSERTAALVDLNVQLEKKLAEQLQAEKEKEKIREQLLQSQKMESIGRLAGGVAHDFNNLLTSIIAIADFLSEGLKGTPHEPDVREIKKASEQAARLTNQLLAFSRRQIQQPAVLSINALVSDMSTMFKRIVGEDVTIQSILSPVLWLTKADPSHIEQVLMNLVVNARDAMPTGGTLSIETKNTVLDEEYAAAHADVAPGEYIMLSISDTGTGMDKKILAHIFEPFFSTKEGKGSGLGLATVYGIVKQSRGSIEAYSEPGHGSTLKVYLPRVSESEKLQEAKQEQRTQRSLSTTETVLVIEDEENVRNIIKRILMSCGYTIIEAHDGDSAKKIAQKYAQPVHLVITDVIMPGKTSGVKVVQYLQTLFPGIKSLYMSGYTENVIVHHGVLDGNIKFLQKPFSKESLIRKVREVLDE